MTNFDRRRDAALTLSMAMGLALMGACSSAASDVGDAAGGGPSDSAASNPADDAEGGDAPSLADANTPDAASSDAMPRDASLSSGKDASANSPDTGAVIANAKRVFITSATYSGDLATEGGGTSGLDGADKLCAQAAATTMLGGTWKAWLSTGAVDAIDRISDVGAWYLIDRKTMVFAIKASLTHTTPLSPIAMDETGASNKYRDVWTGTTSAGRVNAGFDCSSWTRGTALGPEGEIGAPYIDQMWTEGPTHDCSMAASLYCFEQ